MNSVELFLKFMVGDMRIPDAPYWSTSLRLKINAVGILQKRFLELIPKTSQKLVEMKSSGQVRLVMEYSELIVLYDVFLNSVYSLFENISRVIRFLLSNDLPESFSKQKKRFLKDLEIDRDYAEILKTTSWYDEINPMRDEVVHYFSGLVTMGDSGRLGYINIPKSRREDVLKEIKIDDVEKHVKQTCSNVGEFLLLFSNHFLKILNQSSRIPLVCLSSSDRIIGYRLISLKECLNDEEGVCLRSYDCPKRATCQASKS